MSTEPLKPQYFLLRENGSMVPLIAMDELPTHISIRNVSRTLSPYEVAGMTCVGTCEARHLQHIVDTPASFSNSILYDRSLMASKHAPDFDQHLNEPEPAPKCYQGVPKAYGIHEQAPSTANGSQTPVHPTKSTPAPAAITRVDRNAHPLPPWHDTSKLPLQAAPGVKEYCSYWLRHGECDYAQQGCLYKHEMPLDPAVLQRLGLRDIPRWYRERHGLGSFLAVSNTLEAGDDKKHKNMMDRDWRKGEANQNDISNTRTRFTRMGLGSSEHDNTKQEIETPVCPPSSPQADVRRMTANGTQRRTQTFRSNNHFNSRNLISPLEPVETMAERQNRATLAALEEIDAKELERESGFRKTKKYVNAPTVATDKLDFRPSTASSSHTHSTGSPVEKAVEFATPQTSVEGSESEDLLVQDDSELPKTPALCPIIANQRTPYSSKIPKDNAKGSATRGKKRAIQKCRRWVKAESEFDGESIASGRGRKGSSEPDGVKDKYHGLYDHDD